MKKLLLFLAVFTNGFVGLIGWIIANVLLIQPGGVSSVLSALRSSPGGIPVSIFLLLVTISGLLLAIHEIVKPTE